MPKSLCVYCSSSDRLEPKYYAAATRVGEELARRQWTLVYGGGKTGLMGAVARGVKSGAGRVVGVIPEFMKMRDLEVLQKPIVILNQDGYYDDLLRLCERIVREKFMHATIQGKYAVARTVEEVFPLIEHWSHQPGDAKWFQTK